MKVLVVDIGGTFIKYAFMNEKSEILTKGKVKSPKGSREELIEAIGSIYDSDRDIAGIAISMAGIIDTEKGYCSMGGALSYNNDFYLRDALYKRCPVRIVMENDGKCAAMAEAAVGSLKDVADGFVLIFGTMIGGALIKDHKLFKGKHFSAGEVSYINTIRDGKPSFENVWGNRSGTPHLCQLYADKKSIDPKEVDGIMVFKAVNEGDMDAIECLKEHTMEIAVQIFNLQTVIDPERFAIGGGISAEPVFIDYIRDNLKILYDNCPYNIPKAEVVACQFRNDANLIGALQCFLAT